MEEASETVVTTTEQSIGAETEAVAVASPAEATAVADAEEPAPTTEERYSAVEEVAAEAGDEEIAASTEDSLDMNVEVEAASTAPDPKEDTLTPEESSKYEETRKTVQEELVGVTKNGHGRKRKTLDELKALSTRNYLDETVVPHLLIGMSELSRKRPERPLEWLAKFLEREQEKEMGVAERGDAENARQHNKTDSQTSQENGDQGAVVGD